VGLAQRFVPVKSEVVLAVTLNFTTPSNSRKASYSNMSDEYLIGKRPWPDQAFAWQGRRKPQADLGYDSQCPGRDSKRAPPEYFTDTSN
jgi:hypothetical protein